MLDNSEYSYLPYKYCANMMVCGCHSLLLSISFPPFFFNVFSSCLTVLLFPPATTWLSLWPLQCHSSREFEIIAVFLLTLWIFHSHSSDLSPQLALPHHTTPTLPLPASTVLPAAMIPNPGMLVYFFIFKPTMHLTYIYVYCVWCF